MLALLKRFQFLIFFGLFIIALIIQAMLKQTSHFFSHTQTLETQIQIIPKLAHFPIDMGVKNGINERKWVRFETNKPVNVIIQTTDTEKTLTFENKASFLIETSDTKAVWIDPIENQTVIKNIKLTTLTKHYQTLFSNQKSYFLGLIIACSVPLVWFFHRSLAISQWILVALSCFCLIQIEPIFVLCLLGFVSSLYLLRHKSQSTKLLWTGIGCTLLFLCLGKYGAGLLYTFSPSLGINHFAIPLGISYFVIRLVDTLLSWYRNEGLEVSFRSYLCYLLFPATLPAGPIESLNGFHSNRLKSIKKEDITYGISRILLGLFKKIVIASLLSSVIQSLFPQVTTSLNNLFAAKFLVVNFLYAYIDFSAYSDIAIGLSRLYGYKIMENFTWPIFASNLHEYWRSWHRSLSLWCFRNIYFPFSVFTRNRYFPFYLTTLTVGLWHSFNVSWTAWALYHALGLSIITKFQRKKSKTKPNKLIMLLSRPLNTLFTLMFVIAGYSFVVFDDFATACRVFVGYWKFWLHLYKFL